MTAKPTATIKHTDTTTTKDTPLPLSGERLRLLLEALMRMESKYPQEGGGE